MGFTKALYYPTIDIINEGWLRSAILFWDEINTIVPYSISTPYHSYPTQYLSDEGILRPLMVSPDKDFIQDLSTDTLNYLNSTEGFQVLTQYNTTNSIIHRDKLPRDISRLFDIHPDKLPYEIQYQLRDKFTSDGWFQVDSNFAIFYMTLLANKLCEKYSIALLADNTFISNFTDKVRLGNQMPLNMQNSEYRFQRNRPISLEQGLLTNLIIRGIKISEDSTFEDILSFKRQHQDELGLFRANIAKLTQGVSKNLPMEALQQQIEDIYKDEFLPAYNNFKKALSSSKVKWIADNFMKISFISAPTTALPIALIGLSVPQALLAGAGISLTASVVAYNYEKREKIRTNPYSYLIAVNNYI